MTTEELDFLIQQGEGYNLEFKESYPRNNLLFGLMQRMELVEKIGSGLMRINEMMDEYLLSHPVIEATDAYFGISFERPNLQEMSVEQRMKNYKELGEKLGENQRKIVEIMRNNRNITIPELSLKLDISTTAIENNLAKLKETGFIRRIGPDKGGYWEVMKS